MVALLSVRVVHPCLPQAFGTGANTSGGEHAFELLLVRAKFEVGSFAVGSQRCVDALDLEGGAIEMRRLDGAIERQGDASEVADRRQRASLQLRSSPNAHLIVSICVNMWSAAAAAARFTEWEGSGA